MHYPSYVVASLLGLVACQSQPTQTTPSEVASGTSSTAASSPSTAYQVYRTLLPRQADSTTLHLTGRFASYYGADGYPHTLYRSSNVVADSVELWGAFNMSSHNWRLRRQPGRGDLVGAADGQPVRLRRVPIAAGALRFTVRSFSDSVALFPQKATSPIARIKLQALVSAGGTAIISQVLTNNILRDLQGDTVAGRPPLPLASLYKQQRAQFFQDYLEPDESRPEPADTAGTRAYDRLMNYEKETAAYVLYHQGNLLSLGYYHYEYTGGNHGNFDITGASYDLRTGQRLDYAAIFRPGAAARLAVLLDRAVRPLVGLGPNDPLVKELFEKQMPVTHNVILTNGGVVFMYAPYEIAGYADGELDVFVPLSKLRPLLRAGLPLSAAGAGAPAKATALVVPAR